jgi:hypothetical protein
MFAQPKEYPAMVRVLFHYMEAEELRVKVLRPLDVRHLQHDVPQTFESPHKTS